MPRHPIDPIADVAAATIRAELPQPLVFGSWAIKHREYCLVAVRSRSGLVGRAFALTRDGPVADVVRRSLGPRYPGADAAQARDLQASAIASNRPTLSSGVGLRAMSLVDIATWDLAARQAGQSMAVYLGGADQPRPATAIVGYPPTADESAVAVEVQRLVRDGWKRFKLPIASSLDLSVKRVRAAVAAADGGTVSLDGAWTFNNEEQILELLRAVDVPLEWIEDVVAPGRIEPLVSLRRQTNVPVAMGDEQGGPYFPAALLAAGAVDIVRLDATCIGGISAFLEVAPTVTASGCRISTHMYGYIHAPLLSALGLPDVAVEWSMPGTGVDPYADSLGLPVVIAGQMQPRSGEDGIGRLLDRAWVADQQVEDPAGILGW